MRYLLILVLLLAGCGCNYKEHVIGITQEYQGIGEIVEIQEEGKWIVAKQSDYSGGENLANNPQRVQRNQLKLVENADLINGLLKKPYALTQQVSTPLYNATNKLYLNGEYYYLGSSAFRTLYYIKDSYLQSGGSSLTLITTFADHYFLSAVAYQDLIYIFTSTTGYTWDGTTLTSDAGILGNARNVVMHKERGWAIYNNGTVDLIRFSDIADLTSWPAENVIAMEDDIITYMEVVNDTIFIKTNRGAYRIYGDSASNINIVKIKSLNNLDGFKNIVDHGLYLSSLALYSINGDSTSNITTEIFSYALNRYYTYFTSFNNTLERNIFYDYLNKCIIFAASTANGSGYFLCKYYIEKDAFYKCNTLPAVPNYINFLSGTSKLFINLGSAPTGLNILSTSHDTSNTFKIQTRDEDFDLKQNKEIRAFTIKADAACDAVTVKYSLDGGSYTTLETRNLVAGDNVFYLHGVQFDTISFEISTTGALGIKELAWRFRPKGTVLQ